MKANFKVAFVHLSELVSLSEAKAEKGALSEKESDSLVKMLILRSKCLVYLKQTRLALNDLKRARAHAHNLQIQDYISELVASIHKIKGTFKHNLVKRSFKEDRSLDQDPIPGS